MTYTVHVYKQDAYPEYAVKDTDKQVVLGNNKFLFKRVKDGVVYLTTVKRKLAVKDGQATTVFVTTRCVEVKNG